MAALPKKCSSSQIKSIIMMKDPTQQPVSTSQVRSSFSAGVQSSPKVLPVSKVDRSALTSTKLASKRKRSEVEDEESHKRGFSTAKKQWRNCEEREQFKRPYSHTAMSSKSESESCHPEKRRKTNGNDRELTATASTSTGASSTVKFRAHNCGRTSNTTQRKHQRKIQQRAPKIWIIGSSYIKRGELAARQMFGEKFGLDANVHWFGKGGMRWNGVLPRFYAEISTQSPPDILVIHAGGNDLGLVSALELSSSMKNELIELHTKFPSMKIVLSSINERQAWRYGNPKYINRDRKTVNAVMRKAVYSFGGFVIEHPSLRYYDDTMFVPDGVHFSEKGNYVFLSNIHYVIKNILQNSSHRRQIGENTNLK